MLTTLVSPVLTRYSEQVTNWLFARRPGILQIWHSHYYSWLESLKVRQKRNFLWQLSRKRFIQIGVEVLFITGLLVFSDPLRDMVEGALGRDWLFPRGPTVLFWTAITLVVLAPLVAVWRKVYALS